MLALYHAGVSVCAAKVLISLSEKQLAWESRPLNFMAGDQTSPEYLKLNPNGVVPTLIHDDRVIIESTVINEYLEDICPVPALRPDTAYGRAQMRIWTKREDQFHEAINTITMAIVFRPTLLAAPEAVREARMDGSPDRGRREKWRRVMADGLHASDVRLALLRFAKDLRDMDKALAGRPWLAGDDFTLADVGL